MTIISAFKDGIGRVNRAPAVLAGVCVLTLLMALPLGLTLRSLVRTDLGDSLVGETMASGVSPEWLQEFAERATGLGATLSPSVIGFAAILRNVSDLVDHQPLPPILAGVVAAYLLVWVFLVGGILDRFARNRRTRSGAFFSACGVFFFRFLRLGLAALVVYWVLFHFVHGWLFDKFYGWATHDLAVEQRAFVIRLALYLVFGATLALVALVFDYAKIRAVVEDRRSMLGALLAALRFAGRRPVRTVGLYLVNGALLLLVVAAYWLVAPGAGRTGASMWIGFLVGQVYLLARLWVKLLFYASQTALFQGELAHAGYMAIPQPAWPEPPAAEAIGGGSTPASTAQAGSEEMGEQAKG